MTVRIRLFGSAVRKEIDRLSDLDVLAICSEPYGQEQRVENATKLADRIIEVSGIVDSIDDVSIAWYSHSRLIEMHTEGHLFAWHIFLESFKLLDSSDDLIDQLGRPSLYERASVDIEKFRRLLLHGRASLAATPRNACYEAGMLFLCCRNIAMCASWYSEGGLKFGRYSPYEIPDLPHLEIGRDAYHRFARARIEPARHGRSPDVRLGEVVDGFASALDWCQMIMAAISSRKDKK